MARSKGMLRQLGILLTLTSLALPFQVATSWAEEDAPDETAVVTTATTEEASPEASPPEDETPAEEAAAPEKAAPAEEPAPVEEPKQEEPAPAPEPEPAPAPEPEPAPAPEPEPEPAPAPEPEPAPAPEPVAEEPQPEAPVATDAATTPDAVEEPAVETTEDPEVIGAEEEPAVTASPSPQIQARAQAIEPLAEGDAKVTVDFAAYTPGTYDSGTSTDTPSGGTVESLTPGGYVMCGSYLYYYALVDVSEPGDFSFGYVFEGQTGSGWTLSYSSPVRVEILDQTGTATLTSGPSGYVLTGLQTGDQVEVLMVTQLQCTGTVTGQVNTQVRFDADGIGAQTVPLKGRGEALMPNVFAYKESGGYNDANSNGRADAGETITYTIYVQNTGNAAATNVVVTDTITSGTGTFAWTSPTGFTGTVATVDAGQTVVLTGVYTITQADLDGTSTITNCVSIPDMTPDCVTDNLGKAPSIDITKTATNRPSDAYGLGETVTYDLVVTNTGNVTLTSVVVDDLVAGVDISCNATALASMAPGATTTCTASYVITEADVTATEFTNTATVSGMPAGMQTPETDSDTESVPTAYAAIMLDKSLDTDTLPVAGNEITYTFTVTNEGTAVLSNVGVTDPMFDAADFSCTISGGTVTNGSATLAVGGTMICTVDYMVEQADVDSGSLDNTATATGYWHDSPYTDTDSVSVSGTFTPAIEIVKSATNVPESGKYALGDTVEYSFTVTNTGPVSLTNIQVTDPLIADVSCTTEAEMAAFAEPGSQSLLRPGEYVVCTGSHVITQADVDKGSFYNVAETTGTPPEGLTPPEDTDDETVYTDSRAMIELDKSHEAAPLTLDQELTYYFVATNTGTVTLTDVGITDTDLPGISALECMVDEVAVNNGEATLAPDEKLECSAIYTVTQADVDAEKIENTAVVEGWWGEERVTDTDDDEITGIAMPAIEIVKTAVDVPEDGYELGEVVNYEFDVTNTGNVTLVDVMVSDPLITDITCEGEPIESLLPTASVTCTGSYTIVQADMDRGSVPNTATVDAESTKGVPVSDTDDEVVDTNQMPAIDIVKSVTNPVEGGYVLDDVVEYRFVVTNTGNVTLTDVVVTDPLVPTLDCMMETLAPDATFDCTGEYMITQADMDEGDVPNTATVTGTPPAGEDVSDTDTETVVTDSMPLVDIDKWHDEVAMTLGAEVTYHFDVTNTGTVTLSNVTVSDPLDGLSAITCTMDDAAVTNGSVVLAPGESMECTGTYTVTQADVDAGQVLNEAMVTGTWQDETATDDDDDSLTGTAAPGIAIAKTATNMPDDGYPLGALVEYRFDVTNTGNLTLTHVDLEDPAIPDISCDTGEVSLLAEHMGEISVLNPGQTISCTGEYRITQADVDAGMFHNEVTVTGQPPRELPQVEAEADETVPTDSRPAIELTKTHEHTELTLGNEVTFHLVAKNIGTVTLTDVSIDDVGLEDISELECLADEETLVNGDVTLAPGEELWCTATYTITQADVDAGHIVNTALASGVWGDETVTDDDDDELTGVAQPAMTITKTATAVNGLTVPGAGGVYPVVDLKAGDKVTFTVVVTNTGDVTLHDVAVTDQWFADAECSADTLAVAATLECDFVHEVTDAQYAAGTALVNVANVTARTPSGDELNGSDDETIRLHKEPAPPAPAVVEKPAPTVVKPLPPRAGVGDGPINGRVDLLALVLGGALVGAAAWTKRATVRTR